MVEAVAKGQSQSPQQMGACDGWVHAYA